MLGENVDIKFWGLFSARNNYDHRSIKCPQYTSIIFHIDVAYPHYIIHKVTKKNNAGKTIINNPPVVTIFIGAYKPFSNGWFMTLFYQH